MTRSPPYAVTGRLATTLSIGTNDRDENPFEIEITGFVETVCRRRRATRWRWSTSTRTTSTATFDVLGDFREVRRDTRFVDNDYHYAVGGDQTARWTLDVGSDGPQWSTWRPPGPAA